MFQSISRVSFLYKLIFLVVGLAVAFGVFASPAKAQSTADLQRMVEQLLQQIAQLKAQTEIENIRGQVESCPNLTYNLKVGDTDGTTGGEVSQLQAFLVKKYGLNRADYVTGYFGLGTRGLVNRFQSENGLMVVGIAGPQTRAKIANVCGDENKGQRLDVKVSPSDPDSYSILLTENVASESWYHIFSFRLSAEKSDSEIFVRKLPIYLSKSSTEDDVLDFVKDIRLEIDGEVYDDYTANDIDPQTARVLFNLDGDLEIEAGDYVEVEVAVKFAPLEKEEWAGVQIEARAEGPAIDAQGDEGELGDSDLYGQARGESHHFQFGNLVANMMDYEVTLIDSDKGSTIDDVLEFVVDFELTAVDDDVYIPRTAGKGGQGGVNVSFYEVSAKDRLDTDGTVSVSSISSTADVDGGYFVIDEGTTEEFTYRAHFKPVKSGTYRMQMDSVRYANVRNKPTDEQMLFRPEHLYSTGEKFISGLGSTTKPVITKVEPAVLVPGKGATLYGTNVTFDVSLDLNGKALGFVSYNTGKIEFTVPANLAPGKYPLTVKNKVNKSQYTVWVTVGASETVSCIDTLKAGQSLTPGQSIQSCNKEYSLNFGTDGNLEVLYKNNKGIWTSNTAGSGATTLTMQTDGNLVLYTKSRKAVWSLLSYQGGRMGTGQYLWLKDDGTLAVYNQKGEVRWSTSMTLKTTNTPTATSTTPLPKPVTPATTTVTVPTGTLSVTPCTIGSAPSKLSTRTDVCDSTITWSTQNATKAYTSITGSSPYLKSIYPYGYTTPGGNKLNGTNVPFWTPAGTYTVSLYVNGDYSNSKTVPNTGTKVAEKTITVAPAVVAPATPTTTPSAATNTSSTMTTVNQMANVLEALRSILQSWR